MTSDDCNCADDWTCSDHRGDGYTFDKISNRLVKIDLTGDVGKGRFIWDGRGRGIWDNELKCWVTWASLGGVWGSTDAFKAAMMAAINESPATLGYKL